MSGSNDKLFAQIGRLAKLIQRNLVLGSQGTITKCISTKMKWKTVLAIQKEEIEVRNQSATVNMETEAAAEDSERGN